MRLLIVTQYFWPENFRVNDVAAELSKLGHDVSILTATPNYPNREVFAKVSLEDDLPKNLEKLQIFRVPIVGRGNSRFSLILNYLSFAIIGSIFGLLKLRRCKYDVVLMYQLSPLTSALPAILLAKYHKVPLALWVIDLWPHTLIAMNVIKSKYSLAAARFLSAKVYKNCQRIFVQSKSFVEPISAMSGNSVKISYLPTWAEDVFVEDFDAKKKSSDFHQNAFNILFAGNIGEAQDFPCILDAAERVKSEQPLIKWVIVGDGSRLKWLQKQIERRGLEENIKVIGRKPLQEMPLYLKGASGLLVTLEDKPVYNMTIPAKLQSYLAVGVPIVAAIGGEGAKIIEQARAGFVARPGDSVSLAKAVIKLYQAGSSIRRELGTNGAIYYAQEFDKDKLTTQLEKTLKNLSQSA